MLSPKVLQSFSMKEVEKVETEVVLEKEELTTNRNFDVESAQ